MLPIDYQDLPPDEVKRLAEWFADPAYGTLRDVLQAKLVFLAERAIQGMADGDSDESVKSDALEVQQAQAVLDLLEAAAKGYYGSDESNEFVYQRLKAKL